MAKANQIRAFLGMDLTQFQKGLKKAEQRLYRTMRTLDQVGQGLTRTITMPVIAFGAASIKAAADIDKLKKGLEGIMQDAGLAAKEFNNLRKIARNPGLDLKSAVQGSIKLQAIGYSADEARHKLGTLANAVALVGGTGEDLGGVALAITQIIGKGKVQAEEINQIAERLPQVRKAMQDAFGTADTEVLQKMGMSAENFVDDIVNELAKLPKAKASISDTLNNLKDDFNVLAASIGVKLFPIFNKLMGVVLKIVTAWGRLSDAQQNSIVKWGLIAAAIGPAILALKGVVSVMHQVTKAMMSGAMLNPYIAGLVLLAGAVLLVAMNWEEVKNKIVESQNVFADFYNENKNFRDLVDFLVGGFEFIYANVKATLRTFKNLFDSAKAFVNLDFDEIGKIWDKNTESNKDTIDEIGESWKKMYQSLAGTKPFEIMDKITISDVNNWAAPLEEKLEMLRKMYNNLLSGGVGGGGGGGIENIGPSMSGTSATGGTSLIPTLGVQRVSIKPVIDKDAMKKVELDFETTFGNVAKTIEEKFNDIVDITSTLFGQMSGIVDQFFTNKYARAEKDYEEQKAFIEGSIAGEGAKAKMMEEIEATRAKKVSEIKRKEAIANKARAIFDSIINTAVAVSASIANPILAAVIGGLGAAQTALIASQPIPMLAKGGLATAPTMAVVGDNKNAKVDPEVIAPLSKLKGMLGGNSTRLYGQFGIAGDDLRLVIDTANYNYSRNSGYGRTV